MTMDIICWAHFHGKDTGAIEQILTKSLQKHGILVTSLDRCEPNGLGICFVSEISPDIHDLFQTASNSGFKQVIAIIGSKARSAASAACELLQAGASDVLVWSDPDSVGQQIRARFERWRRIEALLSAKKTCDLAVGESAAWQAALRRIIEIAHFSDAAALILGESGTGKEVVARLIHQMDARPGKRELVIQDCSTVVAELSGSEFFGHERGAFTGALSDRQGSFALANGGTLFLDEIGELPLPVQAQLLRAVQERTYKRVGGSTWHRSDFRLICATNRDIEKMVQRGEFRADLYYRIAGFVCRLPPLRERPDDVIPLAQYFIRQMHPGHKMPALDPMVRDYLLRRDYPGNVRELKQVVARLMNRCADDGTISIGYVPHEERPSCDIKSKVWIDSGFETTIHRAVLMGAGLKEIGRAAEAYAIRCATNLEGGSLQRAAQRLGVTDRALQMRRANTRGLEDLLEDLRSGDGMDTRH
jgi:transcriptional regulator with GAF, ATPase, and Fis domain